MKALTVVDRHAVLVERPVPTPGPGEALVGVTQAGICATDLEIVRGYADHAGILGHEMVGRVLEHPDESWVGRRVAVSINVGCGRCDRCRTEGPEHCAQRTVIGIRGRDGGFASRLVAPVDNLHSVPDDVDDDQAVFTEPLAAALRVAVQLSLSVGDEVAVVGDGKLGLLIALALRAEGANVHLFGRHAHKLAIADAAGVTTHDADPGGGRRFAVVVDATGSAAGLQASLDRVRPRGTLVVKSTVAQPVPLPIPRIVVDEIRVVGSRCGPFDRALAALADGRVDPRPLIEARYGLEDGVAAIEHAGRRGALKILLRS